MHRWTIPAAMVLILAACASQAAAQTIPLKLTDWHTVNFDGIPPTAFTQIKTDGKPGIAMKVNGSSAFRVYAFKKPVTIKRIAWQMRYHGLPRVKSKKEEASKAGDDFVLRVGLIRAGDHHGVPFFAPGWVKHMAKILKLPAGKVIYLVASRHHAPGSTWPSPYSDKLSYVSIAELKNRRTRGWFDITHSFPKPVRVVGLWLMADGDNTHADFTSAIRDLNIH